MSLDWIYYAISWILLRWHAPVGRHRLPDGTVLGTNWDWILAIVFLVVTVRVDPVPGLRQADQVAAGDAGAPAQGQGAAGEAQG